MKNNIGNIAKQLLKEDKDRQDKKWAIQEEERRLREKERKESIEKDGSQTVTFLRTNCIRERASDQEIIDFMSGVRPEGHYLTRKIHSELYCCEDGCYSDEYKRYVISMKNKGIILCRTAHHEKYDPGMHRTGGYYGTTFSFSIKL